MKGVWRTLKFVALGLALLVGVLLIGCGVTNWRASARLEAAVARLRAEGEPMSLAELARPAIPAEANAATYLARATNDMEAVQTHVNAAEEKATEAEQEAFNRNLASPAILAAIREGFVACPNVLSLLRQASECTDYSPQHNYQLPAEKFLDEYLKTVQEIRASGRVLRYAAILQLSEGKHEEALQSCLTTLRLARHFDREPLIVGYLISLAVRGSAIQMTNLVLRSGPLPDGACQALDDELARHDLVAAYRESLLSERAFGNDMWRNMRNSPMKSAFTWLPWFKDDQADYLELLGQLIADAGRPYSEGLDARIRAGTMHSDFGTLTSLIIPAVQAQQDATARVQAQIRALRVLNAIVRREQAGNKTPFELADLGLPAEVTTDPYNGKPLLVKNTPDGWVIYSVGKKLSDGGGTKLEGRDNDDVGLGPVKPFEAKPDDEKPKAES